MPAFVAKQANSRLAAFADWLAARGLRPMVMVVLSCENSCILLLVFSNLETLCSGFSGLGYHLLTFKTLSLQPGWFRGGQVD